MLGGGLLSENVLPKQPEVIGHRLPLSIRSDSGLLVHETGESGGEYISLKCPHRAERPTPENLLND